MKKLKIVALTLTMFLAFGIANEVNAQVQMIKNGKRVLLTYPNGITTNKTFTFPTFDYQAKDYAATIAVSVNELYTYVLLDTMTGNSTVNLTISSAVTPGAQLYIEAPADSIRTLTLGTGFKALPIVGVANKAKSQGFIYNGSTFVPIGASVQVN